MENTTTTDKERIVLRAIARSEYQSSDSSDESIIGDHVWTFSVETPEVKGKALSGVISSLCQKGLVEVGESEGDDTIGLTRAGFDAIVRNANQI